jgi:hypothetical protein
MRTYKILRQLSTFSHQNDNLCVIILYIVQITFPTPDRCQFHDHFGSIQDNFACIFCITFSYLKYTFYLSNRMRFVYPTDCNILQNRSYDTIKFIIVFDSFSSSYQSCLTIRFSVRLRFALSLLSLSAC